MTMDTEDLFAHMFTVGPAPTDESRVWAHKLWLMMGDSSADRHTPSWPEHIPKTYKDLVAKFDRLVTMMCKGDEDCRQDIWERALKVRVLERFVDRVNEARFDDVPTTITARDACKLFKISLSTWRRTEKRNQRSWPKAIAGPIGTPDAVYRTSDVLKIPDRPDFHWAFDPHAWPEYDKNQDEGLAFKKYFTAFVWRTRLNWLRSQGRNAGRWEEAHDPASEVFTEISSPITPEMIVDMISMVLGHTRLGELLTAEERAELERRFAHPLAAVHNAIPLSVRDPDKRTTLLAWASVALPSGAVAAAPKPKFRRRSGYCSLCGLRFVTRVHAAKGRDCTCYRNPAP
jgi:hypothetical protein